MNKLEKLNINKVARAIEKDAGRSLPGLRTSLRQAKAGEAITVLNGSRPASSMQAVTK